MKEIKRNEIYYAALNPVVGSEQGGFRSGLKPVGEGPSAFTTALNGFDL